MINPAAVALGRAALDQEIGRALVLPRTATALRDVLSLLDSAAHVARHPEGAEPFEHAAGVLVSLLDSYRRVLASIGDPA